MTEPTLAAIDKQLLLAADEWMKVEARERVNAYALEEEHARINAGGFKVGKHAGDLREKIRDAMRFAQVAQDQAMKIRREILGPRMRGAGTKEPVAEPPKARDPATQALIDKRNAEKAAKEARRAPQVVVEIRTCEACGSDMPLSQAAAHAEVCTG